MDDEIPEEAVDRLRELYRARFARCIAAIEGKEDGRRFEDPVSAYRELRRELIELERGVLAGLRGEGRLRVDDLRKIERDLDLDEARLRS